MVSHGCSFAHMFSIPRWIYCTRLCWNLLFECNIGVFDVGWRFNSYASAPIGPVVCTESAEFQQTLQARKMKNKIKEHWKTMESLLKGGTCKEWALKIEDVWVLSIVIPFSKSPALHSARSIPPVESRYIGFSLDKLWLFDACIQMPPVKGSFYRLGMKFRMLPIGIGKLAPYKTVHA